MQQTPDHTRVLTAFATYGYRKASMSDLAKAVGVSRQTLYNRFQDKQAVLAWAVTAWAEAAEAAAVAALCRPGQSAAQRLVGFFSEWLGSSIPVLRGLPHGAEIFDMANAIVRDGHDETELEPPRELVAFLENQNLAGSAHQAEEAAYVMVLASKGLLLKVADAQSYAEGMGRVVRHLLGDPASAVIAAK